MDLKLEGGMQGDPDGLRSVSIKLTRRIGLRIKFFLPGQFGWSVSEDRHGTSYPLVQNKQKQSRKSECSVVR